MIWQALLSKYRARGPLGFAYDALETSAACGVISVHALVLAASAATLVVVTPVVAALKWVGEPSEYRER